MKYAYGDHPTKKEILIEHASSGETDSAWKKVQNEWRSRAEKISLKSRDGEYFWFIITPYLLNLMTKISEQRGFLGAMTLPAGLRNRIKEKAINYEAYYSSHIEGAQSSLEEALRFMKKKQKYSRDESLQMIKNNRRALEYAMKQRTKTITHDLICKLQYILTENTHRSRPITVGEYRHGPVYIVNGFGQVVYEGPPAEKVPQLMEDFVAWINQEDSLNPLIKSGIVHLYFVHIHPFDDGNGRTARALSNLVLSKLGFQFINMLSLSSYFDHKRPGYYRAIQDVRGHEYDLTYFLVFFMEALSSKLEEVMREIAFETKVNDLKELISPDSYQKLNRRHIKALRMMLRTNELVTTRKYCKLNKCSDETARKDFIELLGLGLIESVGEGRNRGYKLVERQTARNAP